MNHHIPKRYGAAFVRILKEHQYHGPAESIETAIKREGGFQNQDATFWFQVPDGAGVDLFKDLADVLRGERTESVREAFKHYTQMASVMLTDDPKIPQLDKLPVALENFLTKNCTRRGWLYQITQDGNGNNVTLAYIPISAEYHEQRREDGPPYVNMSLIFNGPDRGYSSSNKPTYEEEKISVSWQGSQVTHKTVSDALRIHHLYPETELLEQAYDEQTERYHRFRHQTNEQFRVVGTIRLLGGSWRYAEKFATPLRPSFVVNDESMVKHQPSEFCHSQLLKAKSVKDKAHKMVPFHPYMFAFDMGEHDDVWVHTDHCEEFVYMDIADKLVLPEAHSHLVDAVTHEMGHVGTSDIIGDKGAGTPVLSIGKPGIGKTLMAEVVSHRMKRPLYKINAGYLLGGESNRVTNVEKALKEMLLRCERQKLIPLIDECDVLIATRRADNLTQAAIVAAFLRVLEYFNGLLFLTSNRDDIDDAIISRMAAVIRFMLPDQAGRKRIWEIQNEAQGAKLPPKAISELSKLVCNGRDINRLLSLALRYQRIGSKLDMDLFKRIAVFRGIEFEDTESQAKRLGVKEGK